MSQLQSRVAATILRRQLGDVTAVLPAIDDLVATLRPAEPLYCLRPAVIAGSAAQFVGNFPGDTLYAVKCNPEPAALQAVWEGGVRHFDCASYGEVALVRAMFPTAHIHFMHPVKARPAISGAYALGVRDFVFDSAGELAKILMETGDAADLGLFVRLAMPPCGAMYELSGKFGAELEDAVALLRAARPRAVRLGVSFHVGSQCLDPLAYRRALAMVGETIRRADVAIDVVDVGGGFPVRYPDIDPPPLGAYFAEIQEGFEQLGLAGARLWAEPGRALVAAGASVVVQVQLRRGEALYVNDGVYGSLSDAGVPGFRFPARLIRPGIEAGVSATAYALFGPTCDSADQMRGPFLLPSDMQEGDWVEIGQLGAYGACLRTAFNGFEPGAPIEVRDVAMLASLS